jgi:hypothetical protein
MSAIDWSKIWKKYRGQWVTLENDEITVISNGKTAKEAWDRALARGHTKPILTYMPEELITYVGYGI